MSSSLNSFRLLQVETCISLNPTLSRDQRKCPINTFVLSFVVLTWVSLLTGPICVLIQGQNADVRYFIPKIYSKLAFQNGWNITSTPSYAVTKATSLAIHSYSQVNSSFGDYHQIVLCIFLSQCVLHVRPSYSFSLK